MHDSRVSRRYAEALFKAALKFNVVGAVEDDLNMIVRLMKTDEAFDAFVHSPRESREEKAQIVDRIFTDRVTALSLQALRLLLEKRRESEIPYVRDAFVEMRREHEGVIFAAVTSAEPLDDGQRKALVLKLQSQLGKKVEAGYAVDPSLIGGVTVAFGNSVLDGSIKGALSRLHERLRHDLMKQA